MLLPVHIELSQQDALLQLTYNLRPDRLGLDVVVVRDQVDDLLAQVFLTEGVVTVKQAADIDRSPEISFQRLA